MIYLTYFSFYSTKDACWDKVGIYFHLIAAILVFFLLPVSIGALSFLYIPKEP